MQIPFSLQNLFSAINSNLYRSADAASLALFRIAFGLIVSIDAHRYWEKGWITRKWIEPDFHFTYFSELPVLSGSSIEFLTLLWGLSGAMIALGFLYRFSVVTLLLSFGYIFLLEKAEYLNHFYFVLLLAVCLLVAPANRIWSLDAFFTKCDERQFAVPNWSYVLLKGQIEIMLLWAGIVKLNQDWLSGRPLGDWLRRSVEKSVEHSPDSIPDILLPYLANIEQHGTVLAWGAMLLHLVGAPLLLVPKVRVVMLLIYCCFHLLNHIFWSIGIFPWLAMAGSLIFLAPNWPRLFLAKISPNPVKTSPAMPEVKTTTLAVCFVIFWLVTQALIPTRPWFFKGQAHWTEEGHRFSWRMKLRQKSGKFRLYLEDPVTNQRQDIRLRNDLTKRQIRKMRVRPDMIIQYAHFVRDRYQQETGRTPRIYADALVSLNGRPYYPMIVAGTDLAKVDWNPFETQSWIMPHPDQQKEVNGND